MVRPDLSRDELTDIQGQLHMLTVIEAMPKEIETQLQVLLDSEQQTRELKEASHARTVIRG